MNSERGVALILVIFIVALCTIIVSELARTTYLSARSNIAVEHSLQAEYLLKSAVNISRLLIKAGKNGVGAVFSPQDPAGKFADGLPIPPELLGLSEPNIKLELEIRPEESKIPINELVISGEQRGLLWRPVLVNLFTSLGFDRDQKQVDQSGLFPGKVFNAQEMVANVIDYIDPDKVAYERADFAKGVEDKIPEDYFPNRRIERMDELAAIPGFTPKRLQLMRPFVTTLGNQVNVNFAPREVLRALSSNITDAQIDAIIARQRSKDGPFNSLSEFGEMVDASVFSEVQNLLTLTSRFSQVIAKVDYGTSTYFVRAYLEPYQGKELPRVKSVEFF